MATNPYYNKAIFGATVLIDLTSDTVTASKMLSGTTAHDKSGAPVTGNIPTKSGSDLTSSGATVIVPAGYYASNASLTIDPGSVTANTPTINTSTGLVTGSATITAGYVGAGTESATLQLSVVSTTTYNASTSQQEIPADRYLTGKQTILAVTTDNIDAANIKDGVVVKVGDSASAGRIKNVTGTFTDASTVSTGQTAASAGQIRSGYSAWVDGVEVQGTLSNTSVVIGTTTVSSGVATRGTATWNAGYIAAGSIPAAEFSNTADPDITYVDISDTSDAPVLISGGKLYIKAGICDNLCISTAKLSPDGASADLAADKILSGYSAYDNNSNLIAGSIPTKTSTNVTVSGNTVTIPSGYYASEVTKTVDSGSVSLGNPTLNTSTGLVTATVTITGGYVGSGSSSTTLQLTVKTSTDVTVTGDTVSIPAGYYASSINKTIAAGSVTQNAPTVNSSTGVVTATATVGAGYVSSDTKSNTLQLSTKAGETVTPTRSTQTVVASGKYTLGDVKVGPIPSNYYLLSEVYPVGSLWATESTTATPASTLGFGTWTQILPANATWGVLKNSNWNINASSVDGVRVFKRTA